MGEGEARPEFGPSFWLGAFLLAIAVWLTVTFAPLLVEVLAVVFGAFLVSLAIKPLADALGRWRIPRGVTVLVVYVLVMALLGTIGGVTGTAISGQVALLRQNAPNLVEQAITRLKTIPLLDRLSLSFDTLAQNLGQGTQVVVGTVFGAATGAGRIVVELIMVMILAFFFVTDQKMGHSLLNAWVPASYRDRARTIAANATQRLSRWVGAQLIIVIYFTVVYGAGLMILGVPFAAIIAIIGGILELVPFVGGVIALVLSVLAALTVRPILVLWVVVLYAVVTQVEANLIQPNLYSQAVDVHPALVLVALFVGGAAGGIFGALFAVPVVVVIMTIVSEFRQPAPDE